MADVLKYFIINGAECYESDTATARDAQGGLKRDLKTVTHNSNVNENITDTSNNNFEQKLFNYQTLPVVVSTMNPIVYQWIAPVVVVSQTLLTPATKEIVSDAALGGAWVNRTPRKFIRTGEGTC